MSKRQASPILIGFVCLLYCTPGGTLLDASELRFRSETQVSGGLVRLGDVADIFASDLEQVQRLAAIELFPAPARGEERFVGVKEIQDILLLREVNLAEHTFSGASQIAVSGVVDPSLAGRTTGVISQAVRRKAQQRVAQAIADYLDSAQPNSGPWRVQTKLEDADVQRAASASEMTVVGERTDHVGSQQFLLEVTTQHGREQFAVVADAGLSPTVVVAARPLPRGALIAAADLQLAAADSRDQGTNTFKRIEELIGQEVVRSLVAEQVITTDLVRRPILVHRRDAVTVYARSPGIQIRTTARAKEDGSLGDLVAVESLLDRKPFFARVSGFQEVEVYARAPVARSNEPLAAPLARQDATDEARGTRAPRSAVDFVRPQGRSAGRDSNRPARLGNRSSDSPQSRGQ